MCSFLLSVVVVWLFCQSCSYMYMWSRVQTPSEAAQFFSLSAFGLCLTSLVLICIYMYMYEIDHVGNAHLYVNTSPLHVLVQVPVSPFPVLKEMYMYMYLLHSVWFFLSSLYSSSFCSLWCTRHVIVHVQITGSLNIFPSLSYVYGTYRVILRRLAVTRWP